MFKGIDHVVIAVRDLDAAVRRYENLYGMPVSRVVEVPTEDWKAAFFTFADAHSYIVLIAGMSETGRVGRLLAERGEGVDIVAMKVDDITQTVADLREKGVRMTGDPGPGKPVEGRIFIEPSETGGVLTQLIQR
jgi:methylmalonyl-CoA/ethylmalonyl-CoA epimerase